MATQAPEAQISDGKPQRYQRIEDNAFHLSLFSAVLDRD